MAQPTADEVRKAVAEQYGRADVSDEQVAGILSDPAAIKKLGLEPGLLDKIEDFTRPLTEPPAFVREGAAKIGNAIGESERARLSRMMTPASERTRARPIGTELAMPDFTPGEGEFDVTQLPGMAVQGAAEFLNPFDILTTIASGGSSVMPRLATKLRVPARIASGAMAVRGGSNILEGVSEGDIPTAIQGGLETLAGVMGVRGTRPPTGGTPTSAAPAAAEAVPDDLADLQKVLSGDDLTKIQSPDDLAKLVTGTRSRATVSQMVDELKQAKSWDEVDAVLARHGPAAPPATAADAQSVSAGQLRAQRLETEKARTVAAQARAEAARTAAARAGGSRPGQPAIAPPGASQAPASPRLGPATVPPATTAGERAADSAFPLSARVSDPSTFTLPPVETPPGGIGNAMTETRALRGPQGRFLRAEAGERTASGTLKKIRVGDQTIDLTNLPGGKLTAAEVKDLLMGRGKLLAQAKGRHLPEQVVSELDRMGVEYRRQMAELHALRAAPYAQGTLDLTQAEQATRELGFRLAQETRRALTDALKNEKGAIDPALAIMLGRASASLTAGVAAYTVTDDPEDKLTNAVLAAGGTALATVAIPAVTKALLTSSGRGKATQNVLDDYLYFSMLSRPATILRANMGALSGGAHGVLEKLLAGDTANARKILVALMEDLPGDWLHAVQNGVPNLRVATGGRTTGGLMALPLRLIAAGDHGVVKALTKGGFSLEDAQRLTMAGPPASKLGQEFVSLIGKRFITRLLSPFPRVQTLMVEHPTSAFWNKAIPTKQRIARAAISAGVGAGAYELGKDLDPRLRPFVVAAAGPNAIPAALGIALGWANEQKLDPTDDAGDQISQMMRVTGRVLGEENPFSIDPESTVRDVLTGQRFVPGAVSDVARVMDEAPYGRDRREQGLTASARSRIPGEMLGIGRETLPEREVPRDIFGGDLPFQERPDDLLSQILMGDPVASDLPSRYPADSSTAQELRRLGVTMTPPRGTLSVGNQAIDLPPGVSDQLIRIKGEMLERALTQIINSPDYAGLSDELKAERLDAARTFISGLFGRDEVRAALVGQAKQRSDQRGGAAR